MANNEPKSNNILIIGLFSFLITVVIAGTFIFITFRQVDNHGNQQTSTVTAEEIGPLVPLGSEIIVNIPADDGSDHYLKVNITLEVKSTKENEEKAKEEVTKRIPQFRDLIISILSTKTKEKIGEKEGKDSLRSEIIASINRYLIAGKVNNLFFEDFVVQ
ncbi:flagellar FliL protein [Hydrogenispora ethanolica]|jgi:flagellar FliL protein|uniref:Flagellar protein FliL n=1 Tax=Hydrogenispora ethanolica TaxID=1082276 RepID=A0A4R1RLB9_HYDET|nr:flagellar basal body-associated FliL family protein [Hydrogenispora ethanolica]TCL66552.1 flagellar FliL protein [Hydrogenispora ethanolica]